MTIQNDPRLRFYTFRSPASGETTVIDLAAIVELESVPTPESAPTCLYRGRFEYGGHVTFTDDGTLVDRWIATRISL